MLVALVALAGGTSAPGPSRALERAVGLMGMFEFAAAEAEFGRALEADPASHEARLGRAIAVLNQSSEGAQSRAIALLDEVLRDRPGDPRAEYCKGLGWLFLGEPGKALPCFRRVQERFPSDAHVAFYVGQCCELLGEARAARDNYRRARELDPLLRSAPLGLQRVASRLGDEGEAAEALADFERLALDPRSRLAEFKYSRMGSLGEAVLPAAVGPAPAPPEGPVLAALGPMPVSGVPPAPAVVRAMTPAADLDGDGTLDFVAQVEFPDEFRVERRFVRSGPGGGWAMDPATTDALRRGRMLWGDLDNDGRVDVAFGRVDAATRIIGGGMLAGWSRSEEDGSWRQYTFGGDIEVSDDLSLCADLDHDGDLDFVLTGPRGCAVLWNRAAPGPEEPLSWERREIAGSLAEARAAAADLDGDGDLDLLLWSAVGGAAQAWRNDRLWTWEREHSLAAFEATGPSSVVAFRRNHSGQPALAALAGGVPGAHEAVELWERAEGRWGRVARTTVPGASALWVTDLAGSGHSNVVVLAGGDLVVLDSHAGPIERIPGVPAGAEPAAVDARGPVVVAPAAAPGGPPRWLGPGPGRWPFAALDLRGRVDPSQQMRSNASGIGTRVDARVAGEWAARDALPWRGSGPQALEPVLLGLAGASQADFVTVDWPDGVMQTELAIGAGNRRLVETQRQISSCPVLFAWDGRRNAFVTDCLGVGGIGYLAGVERRGAVLQAVYPPPRPWERVRIGEASALAARDGCYELRLSEPMEEACYLDAARLAAWDVPEGWTLVLDERMSVRGPAPSGEPRFFRASMAPASASVRSGTGAPVPCLGSLSQVDGQAADPGPADPRFVGRLAAECALELEFPRAVADGPGEPALVVDGWVEYPYSTTGFAMWQAGASYQAPSIDALDPATGAWTCIAEEVGYPAGMPRTCLLPIPAGRIPGGCTRLRIRTTMELYADAVRVAWIEPCPEARRSEAPLRSATLLDAGFPRRIAHPQRRPEFVHADRAPLWDCRKQPGRYTRFGECTPLVARADDALAVFGAGEELLLRFEARAAAAPAGTTRTWVLEVDGWCKDMDPLTRDGATIGPLPARGAPSPEARELHGRWNDRLDGGR